MAAGATEANRSPMTADSSALAETPKLKAIDINIWFALMGPARMPEPVVAKL